jgi:ABC-type uncharacterized transport system permease subunit
MISNIALLSTLILYGLGTAAALGGLFNRSLRLQQVGAGSMLAGLIAHTIWIGAICVSRGGAPLNNLPEATGFIAWSILALHFILFVWFRVHAVAFFVYPFVLLLSLVSALVHATQEPLHEAIRSKVLVAHLLFSTVGVAALLIGLVFTLLLHVQERSLKSKRQGRLFDWIPSLRICDRLSYRALAAGFSIYTFGLLAGALWSYRIASVPFALRSKELAAIAAWILFAALLQIFLSGSQRARRTLVVSAFAFASLMIAIFGINYV